MALATGFASRSAVLACILVFAAPASGVKAQDRAQDGPIMLVPHRAIYELTLGQTRGNAQIVGVRGRILYDRQKRVYEPDVTFLIETQEGIRL